MSSLVPLPIVIPILAAAVSIMVGHWRVAQRVISVVALTATLAISVGLLVGADNAGYVVHQAGDWPATVGISLVVRTMEDGDG